MIDPNKLAEYDQNLAFACEHNPRLYWGLFKGYKEAGFTEEQAMDLIRTQIIAVHSPRPEIQGDDND